MNSNLVLVFGMPRSGTTWLGKIFDSHPGTLYMHEPDSWYKMEDISLLTEGLVDDELCGSINQYMAKLLDIRHSQVTSKRPLFYKEYQSLLRFNLYKLSVYFSKLVEKANIPINANTFPRIGENNNQVIHVIWKSIESLGRLSSIIKCNQEYKAIHIIRNPAGYIASVLNGEEHKTFQSAIATSDDYPLFEKLVNTSYGHELGFKLSDLRKMTSIERLAYRWKVYNETTFQECCKQTNYVLLKYEDLCKNPFKITEQLFDFAGLKMDKQTLSFLNKSASIKSSSYYSIYKDPIETSNKWKKYLTLDNIHQIKTMIDDCDVGRLYAEELMAM